MTDFLLYLQQFSNPLLDSVFLGISALTGELVYLAVLGVIYWCVSKEKAYYIGIFLFMSFSLNSLLKNLFRIPRPYIYSDVKQLDIGTGYGYSFPSGHAQLSTTFAGMFSSTFRKRWIYIASALLIVLTGFSRMYLGVHTPVDILCGISVGLLLTLLGNRLKSFSSHKVLAIAVFLFMLGVSLVFSSEDNLKILFFAAGFISGNIIEERFIGYKIPEKVKPRIFGAFVGFIFTVALNIALKAIGLTFVRYLFLGLFITVAVPYFIKKITI